MDCIFCKIISGEIESSKVYEDQDILAFLDLHPINPGHTLVIPKNHSENIYDIPVEDLQKVVKVAKELAIKIKRTLKTDGISIFQMNENAGNQDIMHYHLHIIPRHEGDWFNNEIMKAVRKQQVTNPTREELNSVAAQIKED